MCLLIIWILQDWISDSKILFHKMLGCFSCQVTATLLANCLVEYLVPKHFTSFASPYPPPHPSPPHPSLVHRLMDNMYHPWTVCKLGMVVMVAWFHGLVFSFA